MSDKYNATLDGFQLELETISDSFDSSIARYEFPYKDGALLEDMGQKARVIRFRCYFYGETYEDHIQLLGHIKSKRDQSELLHPKYGLISGSIESVSVRHDDRLLTAEIDIVFIENITATDPVRVPNVESGAEDAYIKSQEEQMSEFAADMRASLGSEAEGILDRELDPAKGVLEQFQDLTGSARNYITQVDTYVNKLESTLNNVANPANSLIATIDYGTTLPGKVIGAIAKTAERYSILYSSLKTAPTRFLRSFIDGMTEVKNALGFQKHTDIAISQRLSLDLGYIFSADEKNRQNARKLEKVKSFDSAGNFVQQEPTPALLSVNDIEECLYIVKSAIQSTINDARGMQSLKNMALILQEHAYIVKIESEKLVTVSIDNETPLHLICLAHSLPYQYAERILTVNKIVHPSFTKGEIKVYAG
jgi:prophage DNA circulation protein